MDGFLAQDLGACRIIVASMPAAEQADQPGFLFAEGQLAFFGQLQHGVLAAQMMAHAVYGIADIVKQGGRAQQMTLAGGQTQRIS